VHLGIGAFHRAHQAFYTESCLNSGEENWAIVGASLRSDSVKKQLHEQQGLYTLIEKGPEGEQFQIIGAVKDVLVGPENPEALIDIMSDEDIKIVSLTVTEKGYCHDPATGNLNFEHPDIIHDLANLDKPRSAVGYLAAALARRKQKGLKSFTALSCDNLPNNGLTLEKVAKQFISNVDMELLRWVEANTTFPCTMIDRIVPATTDSDRQRLSESLGYFDEGAVVAEPFTQWVVEDTFCNGRPSWEKVGVEMTHDVDTYENMKLRLLNGSHSTLAYSGYLAGYETINEVMADPAFENMITIFMDREAGETLIPPTGFDIDHYTQELRDRFANPGLKHRTWQIAMDGSQKLPQRLLKTLDDQLLGAGNVDIICLGIAAWIRYVSAVDEQGNKFEVLDPFAEQLQSIHQEHIGDIEGLVERVLSINEIFGPQFCDKKECVLSIKQWLTEFYEFGVRTTVQTHFGA